MTGSGALIKQGVMESNATDRHILFPYLSNFDETPFTAELGEMCKIAMLRCFGLSASFAICFKNLTESVTLLETPNEVA